MSKFAGLCFSSMMSEDIGLITGQNNWLIVKEMSEVNKNKNKWHPPH